MCITGEIGELAFFRRSFKIYLSRREGAIPTNTELVGRSPQKPHLYPWCFEP